MEALKKVIAMLRNPEFDSKEVDPDLHKRLEKAVHDGRIKCFNMRERPADVDQDLNFWTRELEDVVREIMEDPVFKGNQNFQFEMDLDEAGKRLFGGKGNARVTYLSCISTYQYIRLTYCVVLVCTYLY